MVDTTSSVPFHLRRKQGLMHDSTLDLFDDKAAHEYAMMLEERAAALEITVDYYLEEFHDLDTDDF